MSFSPKRYQQETLDTLRRFLARTREDDAGKAFEEITGERYRELREMPGVPYVCLRIPTGGGKTILAAQCLKLAAETYLERDYPLALWLVPSNAIRAQTVEALKNPQHPYRRVLDDAFEGRVRVFDIGEFAHLRPADVRDNACIVVGTIQTLRVQNTEGRKVYDHHEALMPFFPAGNYPPALERDGKGAVKHSFANLLHLQRPLLIVDEAHNAVTGLTREMQARINPVCIIEFTATPRAQSNELVRVPASALKSEEMIKLPLVLSAHTSWQSAVSGAIAERKRLADLAANEREYLRPIVLFQAQNKGLDVTAEVLKQHLIESESIAAARIATVTGEQRELDGVNLFDRACPIEYVITIQALKEGWDCSFAYVFCSLANIRSGADVEQLLGRVLRMPYARKRSAAALNKAYAHVCEPAFYDAAMALRDRLVDMGFESAEAEDQIEAALDLQGSSAAPEIPAACITLATAPDLAGLGPEVQTAAVLTPTADGFVLSLRAGISIEAEQTLTARLPESARAAFSQALSLQRSQHERRNCPAARGQALELPQICLMIQGELELATPDLFLELGDWDLLAQSATLSPQEFRPREGFETFEHDVAVTAGQDRVTVTHIAASTRQPELAGLDAAWDELTLSRWLDRQCRQPDVPQMQMLEFARRAVRDQLAHKNVKIGELVLAKYRLAKSVAAKIGQCRGVARQQGYQRALLDAPAQVEVSFDYSFRFPRDYPASRFHRGAYQFTKHYYGGQRIGEMNSEEVECAVALDLHPKVKTWVRNIESQPRDSFRLPLAHGWFYPDFVAWLDDGRFLVLEHKGSHLIAGAADKENIGQLWALRSAGRGLFLMTDKQRGGLPIGVQIAAKLN